MPSLVLRRIAVCLRAGSRSARCLWSGVRPQSARVSEVLFRIANSADLTGLSHEVDLAGVELTHAGEAREQGEVKKTSKFRQPGSQKLEWPTLCGNGPLPRLLRERNVLEVSITFLLQRVTIFFAD